jgi:hypothetical protein
MMRRWTSRWSGPLIALLLSILALVVLVTAYGYSRSSGLFPIFIGWIFAALVLLELALRVRDFARGDAGLPADPTTGLEAVDTVSLLKDLAGFVWVALFLLAVYLVGFLVATPLFMFAFLKLSAGRGAVYSATAAIAAVAVVYTVFVALLDYRLYAGILFGA